MNQEAPVTVSTAVCLPLESSASPVSSLQQIYCRRVLRARRGRVVHTVLFGGGGARKQLQKVPISADVAVLLKVPPPPLRFQAAKTSRSDRVKGLFDEGTVKNNLTLLEMLELFVRNGY